MPEACKSCFRLAQICQSGDCAIGGGNHERTLFHLHHLRCHSEGSAR